MGRNDVNLLPVPERVTPASVTELPGSDDLQEQAAPAPVQSEVVIVPPPLECCPHCGRNLSAIDLKTNHCFQCGMMLVEAPPDRQAASDDFTVRI
jgi:hypothetical protein